MSALILVQSPPVPLILIVVLPTVAPMMLTVAPGAAALVGLPATVAFAVPVGVAVIVAGVTGVQLPNSQDLRCNVADRDRAIQRDRNWAGRRSHRHAAVMLEGEVCGDADDNDCASDDDRPSPGDRFHVSTPYTFVVLREPEVPAPTILLAVAVLVIGSFICFSPDFPTAQVCKGSSTPFPVQLT